MYAITAPAPERAPAPVTPLGLRAAARRTLTGPAAITRRAEHAPHLRGYLTDLLRPWQLTLDERALSDQPGASYGELCAPLIEAMVDQHQPVDLLVLAFAVPDVRPGRATACYLGARCPGDPLAFAICDQGSAAAFTGLRLIREYAATGGCRRALLLVAEQAGLPYQTGLPADQLPAAHTAVGLLLEPGARAALTGLHQYPELTVERAEAALVAHVTDASGAADTCVVVEPALAAVADRCPAASRVRVAPAGQLHTAAWWELAGELEGMPPGSRLLLASYDRQLHCLCVITIELEEER